MSRIPQPSSTRTPAKATPTTPSKSRVAPSPKVTPSKPRGATVSLPRASQSSQTKESVGPSLSIKEAIALRRAEAKKAQAQQRSAGAHGDFISLEDASPVATAPREEDILGRWSVRETIERARSTGPWPTNLKVHSIWQLIHLGVKPDPLSSVPEEPSYPHSSNAETPHRRGKQDAPSWFEAQDLQVLKAWNNEIEQVQHEISLFGSLKTVDLHKNKLTSLPTTFGDLTALTVLDLSHNNLTFLPPNIFALPELTALNLSHNDLSVLPFNEPFKSPSGNTKRYSSFGNSFFAPTITRATSPLPRLVTLDVSHNKIGAGTIDLEIPPGLTRLDLSGNPLGYGDPCCRTLLQTLGGLAKLKELQLEQAQIDDDAFPPELFTATPFPTLQLLDLGKTKVTEKAVAKALRGMKQQIQYGVTMESPLPSVVRVVIGNMVVKEAWEIELERNSKSRAARHPTPTPEADGDGPVPHSAQSVFNKKKPEVVKEAWEIEAEQGLSTEGGRRRARAAAAAAAEPKDAKPKAPVGLGLPSTPGHSPKPSTSTPTLSSPEFYSEATHTLTLPPSAPPSKAPIHARAFSLVSSLSSLNLASKTELVVPAPTLPLEVLAAQPFAGTLKVLNLINRRMDKSFSLPSTPLPDLLPSLEELSLEGCGLPDLVTITRSGPSPGSVTPPRTSEALVPLVTKLFPRLRTLNLSYNALSSAALTTDVLAALILATDERTGLRHLRLRGNKVAALDGFQAVAMMFKGNRDVPGWKLEELDLRDNEIGKLPPELGLLPLDVFLVDGNTFRVPQRRVWEREGTKGLLSWLRGRIE